MGEGKSRVFRARRSFVPTIPEEIGIEMRVHVTGGVDVRFRRGTGGEERCIVQ
jgi:hypothetical protein